jgi:hypothetical protein
VAAAQQRDVGGSLAAALRWRQRQRQWRQRTARRWQRCGSRRWLWRLGCKKRSIKIGYCEVFKPAILLFHD